MHASAVNTQQPKPRQTHPPGVVISNRAEHLQEERWHDKVANWRQVLLLVSRAYSHRDTTSSPQKSEAARLGYEFDGSFLDSPSQ